MVVKHYNSIYGGDTGNIECTNYIRTVFQKYAHSGISIVICREKFSAIEFVHSKA